MDKLYITKSMNRVIKENVAITKTEKLFAIFSIIKRLITRRI